MIKNLIKITKFNKTIISKSLPKKISIFKTYNSPAAIMLTHVKMPVRWYGTEKVTEGEVVQSEEENIQQPIVEYDQDKNDSKQREKDNIEVLKETAEERKIAAEEEEEIQITKDRLARIDQYKSDIKLNNNVDSMVKLGDLYVDEEGEFAKGAKYYKMAAQSGNVDALVKLGDINYDENLLDYDVEKAVKYYKMAAAQGNSDAIAKLGYIYLWDKSVEDKAKGVEYLREAERLGNQRAFEFLSMAYTNGDGVEQDTEKAIEYAAKLLEMGDSFSYLRIARLYAVSGQLEKSLEYFAKGIEAGHHIAWYELGLHYYSGEGFAEDKSKAVECFVNGALEGNEECMNKLGKIYYKGKYVDKDYKKAFDFFKQAADMGHADAMESVAKMYLSGKGVEKNKKKAQEYYERAMMEGDDSFLNYLRKMHRKNLK